MKPPRCGKCGQEHWSGQPCKGVTESVTRNVTDRNAVTESVTRDDAAVDFKRRMDMWDALVKGMLVRLEAVERRLDVLEVEHLETEHGDQVVRSRPMTNAERQRAYRERQKAKQAN